GENPHEAVITELSKAFSTIEQKLTGGRMTSVEQSAIETLRTTLQTQIVEAVTDDMSTVETAQLQKHLEQIDSFFDSTEIEQYLAQYVPNWNDPVDVAAKKSRIIQDLRGYGGYSQLTYSNAVKRLLDPSLATDEYGNPYAATPG